MAAERDASAADPSPPGEGGRRAATDGWGPPARPRGASQARALRKRMTPQEVKLWNWLRERVVPTGFHVRRQVPIDAFVVDFACLKARLVIEVDGEQHASVSGRARDAVRDRRLSDLGYHVLRFSNRQVDLERDSVLDTIRAVLLDRTRGHPAPVRACGATRPSPGGEGSGRAGCKGDPSPRTGR